jgi:hypothetical protein
MAVGGALIGVRRYAHNLTNTPLIPDDDNIDLKEFFDLNDGETIDNIGSTQC